MKKNNQKKNNSKVCPCLLQVVPLYWVFYILGGSLLTEGGTLLMAVNAIRKGAIENNMTFTEYGESPAESAFQGIHNWRRLETVQLLFAY